MPPQRLTQLSNTASSNSAAWGQRDYFARHRIKTGLRGSNSSPTNCFCQYSFGLVQTNQESRSQPALDPPRLTPKKYIAVLSPTTYSPRESFQLTGSITERLCEECRAPDLGDRLFEGMRSSGATNNVSICKQTCHPAWFSIPTHSIFQSGLLSTKHCCLTRKT